MIQLLERGNAPVGQQRWTIKGRQQSITHTEFHRLIDDFRGSGFVAQLDGAF